MNTFLCLNVYLFLHHKVCIYKINMYINLNTVTTHTIEVDRTHANK